VRKEALRAYLFALHADGVFSGAESKTEAIAKIGKAVVGDILSMYMEGATLGDIWKKIDMQYRRGVDRKSRARRDS
jgi:hypothetical protein